jgi:hypothetical protein
MYTDEDIRKMLIELTKSPIAMFVAKVTEVDMDNYKIDIQPSGRASVLDVRLKAAIDSVKDGMVEIPVVGSTVLCGIINNDKDSCFVIKYSQVEKVNFYGGEQKGIPLHDKVESNLNAIKDYLSDLQTAIETGLQSVGESTAASGSAGKAAFQGAMAGKSITIENMENEKVIQ